MSNRQFIKWGLMLIVFSGAYIVMYHLGVSIAKEVDVIPTSTNVALASLGYLVTAGCVALFVGSFIPDKKDGD